MKFKLPCILYAISLVYALDIKGIDPSTQDLYKASSNGQWTCLDGSKTISYSAINDDYCDCPDGSDEPGTSACPNSLFYCANIGHIPAYVKSSAVNDGVCDEACCDGSDENGDLIHCPNRCKEVGEAYQKELSSLKRSTEAGLQEKKKLIDEANKQITLWQEEQASIEDEIFLKKAELLKAQRELKVRGVKKAKCKTDSSEITVLKQTVIMLQKNINQLQDILSDMKRDHNQNYHDMAVKGAIKAYDEFVERYAKIEQEINNQLEELQEDEGEDDIEEEGEEEEDGDFIESEHEDLEGLNDDLNEEQPIIKQEEKHSVLDIIYEKLNPFIPPAIKTGFVEKYLIKNKQETTTPSTNTDNISDVRKSVEDIEKEINTLNNDLKKITDNLNADYGSEKEWLKLKDVCVEKNEGEYTYSFCILGDAHQKSNKDNTRIFLGNFDGFEKGHKVHRHTHGTRCWNGPDRSVKVFFECGLKNEILTVTEPEKCEYHFTAKSPAVCQSI